MQGEGRMNRKVGRAYAELSIYYLLMLLRIFVGRINDCKVGVEHGEQEPSQRNLMSDPER